MKKVVVASLLACAAIATGSRLASAQTAVALGSQPAAGAPCQMPDAEYKPYSDAMGQTDPKAKAAAIEAYITAFPTSACPGNKLDTLVVLMAAYSAFDPAKTLDAADRVLQLDPTNLRALVFETYLRKSSADSITDPAAKQAALDAAAGFAQKGLAAPKPAGMSDADFKSLQGTALPIFYSAIGTAAVNKKDTATAIDAFKKELASVPVANTQAPGPILQDTYFLALAYLQSTPPDLLDCTFYATRFVAFAPEPFKSQIAPTAKYCYTKYHGSADGYETVAPVAQANLTPPAGFFDSIKPAPTPAEKIHTIITTTPDLGTLATSDKEMVFQYGSPEDAAKVWDTVKGKSFQFPNVIVLDNTTPGVLKVAASDDAQQSKTADFTFNMAPLEEGTTPAQKAAAKKRDEAIAAATAVGQKVTLSGTFDSFTPNPLMITMTDGAVILPKAAPAKAPVHRAPAKK